MSFNSLFGLGSHSPDANLEGWWPLMDNAANTTVTDYSGKGRNGVMSVNTSTRSVAGPNNYLTTALSFGTSRTDRIAVSSFSALNGLQSFSVTGRGYRTGDGGGVLGRIVEIGSTDAILYWQSAPAGKMTWYVEGSQHEAYTPGASAWHSFMGTKNSTNAVLRYNGAETSFADTKTLSYTGSLYIGNRADNARNWAGRLSNVSAWSKTLTTSEGDEIDEGPEPINTVAPVVSGTETEGQTLSCTTGTWGLGSPFSGGSNGTITYAYQWTRSDDGSGTGEANISGATSSTYELQSADVGKYIRCYVAATNDGGRDVAADTPSNFTGAIAGVATGNRRRRLLICGAA
jgi:hypothetical protein